MQIRLIMTAAACLIGGCSCKSPTKNDTGAPQLIVTRLAAPTPGYQVGNPGIEYRYEVAGATGQVTWSVEPKLSTWSLIPNGTECTLRGPVVVGMAEASPVQLIVRAASGDKHADFTESVSAGLRPNVTGRVTARRWNFDHWLFEISLNQDFVADKQMQVPGVFQVWVDTQGLTVGDSIDVLDGPNDSGVSDRKPVQPDGDASSFDKVDGGEWFRHSGSGASQIKAETVGVGVFWVRVFLKEGQRREIADPRCKCVVY